MGPLLTVTEGFRLCESPLMFEVPCATAGAAETAGTAGMMLGRPFMGETEDDFACCADGAEDPAATTGWLEPVATTGVEVAFFALAAEA